jgi:hypothetical protein
MHPHPDPLPVGAREFELGRSTLALVAKRPFCVTQKAASSRGGEGGGPRQREGEGAF